MTWVVDAINVGHLPTPLATKSFNRSLKSELTNIQASGLVGVQDELPGSVEAGLGGLRLPERDIEGPV